MGANLQFHQLSYEQFVTGELNTIMQVVSQSERKGRVTLLSRISAWKLLANVSWPQIRNTYAHILRKIENEEITWAANFDTFERNIYERIATREKVERSDKRTAKQGDWFCKQFQKIEGCTKDSPHNAKIA